VSDTTNAGQAAPAEVSEEAVTRLRGAVLRLGRELRTTSAEEGLTPTQSSVLAALVREGPLGVGELAEAEGINPTMLSRVLAHLTDAGLAERAPIAADRRCARAVATAEGRRAVRRLRARRGELLRDRLGDLPPDQVADLLRAVPALEALAAATRRT
jgi:DNA-binding MarR family transcriptional regulator